MPLSGFMKKRTATINRATSETDIKCRINLDGKGLAKIDTGIGFFDHMLEAFTKHALFDLSIKCAGDLHVDDHHTVEDVGLVIGQAIDKALGDRKGITRFGSSLLPMDESLTQVGVDLGGRPYLVMNMANRRRKIKDFDLGLIEEFYRALVTQAKLNLHINNLYGADPHHAYESVFKGFARAMYEAVALDPRVTGIPSSKGAL